MTQTKTILVSGATGLVGRALCARLQSDGHSVRTLSRSQSVGSVWDPVKGEIDGSALAGVDTVIHLAGETVAQRWTQASRQRILESRVKGAELLVREILKHGGPVHYISASGVNYYGYRRTGPLDETAASGGGFLAEVCLQWEAAADPLRAAGLPCAYVRTGVVLDPSAGALQKLLPPFRAGLGGRIGSGGQMLSWILLEDLVRIYAYLVEARVDGPINAVAPQAVTNTSFTRSLGKVLRRPTILPLPEAAVSALFGEMGRETVLSDLEVVPGRLMQMGFTWKHPNLDAALELCLKR